MSKKKKIIVTVVSLTLVAALIAGGIYGYMIYQQNNLMAEVQSVESLKYDYWGDEAYSYGMVTNDFYQDVFLLDEQSVEEVFVEEGQVVKAGDPLMSYDMTLNDLDIDMQELEIQTIANNTILAQRELGKLRNTTPIPDTPEVTEEPEQTEEPAATEKPQIEEMKKDAYNYISATAKSYDGEGTIEDPYLYLCMPECYVEGSFLNVLADSKTPVFVIFEIREKNKKKGELLASWSVSSKSLMKVEDGSMWSVKTRQEIIEEEEEDTQEDTPDIQEEETEVTGYTAAELKSEIQKKEKELKDLDLDKRKAELELVQRKKLSEEGIVAATIDGIVKTVGNIDKPPTDGSAFITVSGSEGLYVTGSLSEMMLGDVQIGQTVYASSWDSGMSFEATITEISVYPSEGSNSWGEGNPNVSYYPYVAYIEDTEGLKNGEYLELKMSAGSEEAIDGAGSEEAIDGAGNEEAIDGAGSEEAIDGAGSEEAVSDETVQATDGLYLIKAYVREENGKSYVLKADENDRLVKQYVETGKTIYGEAIEIKSGLTAADRIAFPYGKTAKEGLKVKDGSEGTGEAIYY